MFRLLYSVSLVSLVFASCPNGGSFDTNQQGVCQLQCNDGTTIIPITDLTFDDIAEECDNVRNAIRFGNNYCKTLDDLRWPSWCGCPYCICETEDADGSPYKWEQFIQKQCYNCTCTQLYDITDLVFTCNHEASISNPYNWNDFECPHNTWDGYTHFCVDGSIKYLPGEAWFAEVDTDAECNKFCYCGPKGDIQCKTGFDAIINEGSDSLKAAFLYKCDKETQGCINDPSSMVPIDTGPYCSNCPMCDCPTEADVGSTWYTSSEGHAGFLGSYEDATTCARCTCEQDDTNTYAQCDDDEQYPNVHFHSYKYSCPGSRSINCHKANGYHGSVASHELNSIEYKTNLPEAWCSVKLKEETNAKDVWNWGEDNLFCGIYGQSGECSYWEYSVGYTDCFRQNKTAAATEYSWCCDTDDCNFVDGVEKLKGITCEHNDELSALFQQLYTCVYTQQFWEGNCNDLEEHTVTCGTIKIYFEDFASCYCKAYKNLYDAAEGEWKLFISTQIDMFMTQFSQWTDALDCPETMKCDLTRGDGEIIYLRNYAADYVIFGTVSVVLAALLSL